MANGHRCLNAAVARARDDAERHIPELQAAYTSLLRKAGRGAAGNFRQQVITAAISPWNPPPGDLVDGDELETDAVNTIPAVHKKLLEAVTPAAELGISYDLNHPAPQALLAGLSKRLGTLGEAIRQQVNEAVAQGYAEGWSVSRTADEIVAKTDMIAPVRAEALARTDLNSLSNGSSLGLAMQVEGVSAKTWLATDDEKTRETHADADGQTVPIDQTFDVGGEAAQYPADPDLSDEESFNCRCTVTYGDDLTASATPIEGGDMTTIDENADLLAAQAETLAALREFDPALEQVSDEALLAFRSLVLASRKQHGYRGDGGECAICGMPPSDDAAHFQALTAGLTEFTLVAAAGPGEPTRWVAPAIAVEGQPTEDGRILMAGSVSWRDGVLPLGIMLETPHSDMATAPLCGGIDRFERIGDVIAAAGFFNDNSPDATLAETARMAIDAVKSQTARGISVDLMVIDGDLVTWPLDTASEEELPPEVGEEMGVPTLVDPDGDGDIDALPDDDDDSRLLMAVFEGVIGGACIVPVPAIANASLSIIAATAGPFELLKVTTPLFADCGCEDLDVPVSLVAAAAPLAPPAEWFDAPELDGPTPLTITDDGRVFGHIALWNSCHESFPGRCVTPPRSQSGYRKFHNGEFKTADGTRINVGKLTLKAGHAGIRGWSEERAVAHYDNTATIGAFVRASDDRFGIRVAGALKSDLAPELVRDLMASPLSGDWRGGEMVAAHAVIDPGFPVLRASGFGELIDWADEEPEQVEPTSPLVHVRPGRRKTVA